MKTKGKIFTIILVLMFVMLVIIGSVYWGSPYIDNGNYMLNIEYTENFKIMQLADIQAKTVKECDEAFVNINKLVEKEKPNLIVLTGDNVYNPTNKKVINALISNMESLKTPWAPVFGNHDATFWLPKNITANKFVEAKYCLFAKGEFGVSGIGNYVVNLTNANNEIAYSLFMIDSHSYNIFGGGPASIHKNQIRWYERAVNRITKMNNNTVVPSLAFFHIPLQEFDNAKTLYENGEIDGYGIFNEDVSAGVKNTGFFSKAQELKSTKAIVCGHDHKNNCDLNYHGIRLVYGLKSSRNDYHDETLLGATIINLTNSNIEIYSSYFD